MRRKVITGIIALVALDIIGALIGIGTVVAWLGWP